MKKISLLVFACCIGLVTHAQESFQLTGEITKDSRKGLKQLHITYVDEFGDTLRLGTANLKKGKFMFQGIIPEGIDRASLTGFPTGQIDFFLEPGKLSTTPINAQAPEKARVKGSPDNEIYSQFLDMLAQKQQEYATRLTQFKASLPSNITNNNELLNAYIKAEQQCYQTLKELDIADFIINHLYNKVSVYLIHDYCQHFFTSYTMKRDILEAIPDTYQKLWIYQDMLSFCNGEDLKQGSYAPAINGKTPEGNKFYSSELNGKYILVTFWSSNHPESLAEMDYIKQVAQLTDSYDKLAIICISLDNQKDKWLSAIKNNELEHASCYHISTLQGLNSKAALWYRIKELPYTLLLNPDGKLVAKELKGEAMVTKIKRIINGIESYE